MSFEEIKNKCCKIAKSLPNREFNDTTYVILKDKSVFNIKNSFLVSLEDEKHRNWIAIFTNYNQDFIFEKEKVLVCKTLPQEDESDNSRLSQGIGGPDSNCSRCNLSWKGLYTNDMQMCVDCYQGYIENCTCKNCGTFKGGHTEEKSCPKCK